MRPLTLEEIAPREAYEALRPRFHEQLIALKAARRVAVGERVSLLFENRETLRFQVQEMCRVERIDEPEKIQHELDTYNELMPAEGELSATLFIEITDLADIKPELDRLVGIHEHVWLRIGDEAVRARFDARQMEEDRISAVHYIRFALSPAQVERFADPGVSVRLAIDHPNYTAEASLPPAARASLLEDLRGDPAPLITAEDVADALSRDDTPLFTSGRVRALRPARPLGPGHCIAEPVERVASLLEADDALLAELAVVAKRLAAEVVREHGAARVVIPVGKGDRLRWHVLASA